jgi:acetylornithine deacetylase
MTIEQKIQAFIQAHESDLLGLARDLIATPSPTPPGDERAVADRLQAEFSRLGLGSAQTIAAKPERPNLLLQCGTGNGPVLILNGHTDTKPPGDLSKWQQDPFDPVVKDGVLYGLGATDMKGAVAALVYATAALAEVLEHSTSGQVHLLLSADEEGGSAFGTKYLGSIGRLKGDAALIGEACGIRRELEFIHLASRGICCFRVRVHGDQMHSSLSQEFNAVNASLKAAELLASFAHDFKPPNTIVNPGVTLAGGVFFGVVPGVAEFGCDLRVPPGSSEGATRDSVQAWLDIQRKRDPELHAELLWTSPPTTWIPPVAFPTEHRLAKALRHACQQVLPELPPEGCFPAATDAPWFFQAGVPAIPAFGPGLLPLAHSPNERVEISSLYACSRIYALAGYEFLQCKSKV